MKCEKHIRQDMFYSIDVVDSLDGIYCYKGGNTVCKYW